MRKVPHQEGRKEELERKEKALAHLTAEKKLKWHVAARGHRCGKARWYLGWSKQLMKALWTISSFTYGIQDIPVARKQGWWGGGGCRTLH
jgi:hypothetical protein